MTSLQPHIDPARPSRPLSGDARHWGPPPDGEQDKSGDAFVDVALLRDFWVFLWHAVKRRRGTVATVFIAFVGMGVLSALLMPTRYYTEAKLLADRNVVMPLLGNPSRPQTWEADTPTRLASEMILNHDNLLSIVTTADLVREADRTRSVLGKLRQQVRHVLSRPLTEEEVVEEMIWTLRSRMNVQVGEGTVIIGAVWSDPNLAFRIVQAAQQSFVEERQTQEVALITGSIAILEKSAADVSSSVIASLDSLARERSALTPRGLAPLLGASRAARVSPEVAAAQSRLQSTLRSISDLEEFRRRRLEELQSTLAEQRSTYGAAHPLIENTQQLIRALGTDSPQLAQLRRDEQKIRSEIEVLGGLPDVPVSAGGDQLLAAATLRSIDALRSDSLIQEKQQYGRSRLRIAIASYEELLERLDAARIELQTVRATFQFKYGVLIPATVPRSAMSTSPIVIVAGALVLGVLMGLFTAVALDITSGRVLEPWQIERNLGLPVLGSAPLLGSSS